jgi:glycosyltransferase involved in cell wall biosynthesis
MGRRIALVTLLSSPQAPLVDHVEELLPHLIQGVGIDLFTGEGRTTARIADTCAVYPLEAFAGRAATYDATIYALGGEVERRASMAGLEISTLAQRYPSIALVHDAFEVPGREVQPWLDGILDASLGVVVHSDFARRAVLRRCPGARVACIPQHFCLPAGFSREVDVHGLRARWGLTCDFLVGTFGLLGPDECLELCLRAFSALLRSQPGAMYLLGGALPPGSRLEAFIRTMELEDRVVLTGDMDPVVQARQSCLVDLAIQMTPPPSGSAQFMPVRLMGLGLPTILPDTAPMVGLPEGACAKVAVDGHESETLAALLGHLAGNEARRRQLAENGRQYVLRYRSAARVAEEYLRFVGEVLASPPGGARGDRDLLIEEIGAILAGWGVEEQDDYLLSPITEALGGLFGESELGSA